MSTTKKTLTTICIALSALLILDSFNAAHAFAVFMLTGTIPGTSITVSASALLVAYPLIAGFVLSRLFAKRHNTLGPKL